ncbi:MAG: DUF5131 family protein [Phaeodactylibacter sp.]|nr:DUF5131 family protein [Phaeodactylibacter sp.]
MNSAIQWTDATWNVAVGCTKVSPGCKYCYMMRDFEGRYGRSDVNGTVTRTKPGTFNAPLKWQKQGLRCVDGSPLKVFTSSLTDVFHPDIDEYRHEIWEIIRQCPDLIFQILTKRPERIIEHLPQDWGHGYENVWLGVSVESQAQMLRLEELLMINCAVRFASFEPLIDCIQLSEWYAPIKALRWAIIGGESGNDTGKYRYRPCKIEWLEELADELEWYGVPVFVKQFGTHLAKQLGMKSRHGGDISEFPEHLRLRQFPRPAGKTEKQ